MDERALAYAPAGVVRGNAEPWVDPAASASWARCVKRAMDIAISGVLLLAVLPMLVVTAIGVKLSSPGPVLFRQERVGEGGRRFTMLKLRTFPIEHQDVTQSLPQDACPLWFGRLLRRTSLDELPQLFNVLRGDMSIVGPRPERPQFAEACVRDVPGYQHRHRMPAGITGLAQVRGLCGPTSISDRVAADNEYIDRWTLGTDVRILVRTLPTVIRKVRW